MGFFEDQLDEGMRLTQLMMRDTGLPYEECRRRVAQGETHMSQYFTPTAELVAYTIGDVEQGGAIMEADDFVAYAARVSNPSNQMNEETYPKLLRYLQRAKHWSPFEMSNAVVKVTTTRDIAHQILRHHSFRFQEFSQRYAEASNFHIHEARRQDDKNRQNSIDNIDEETKEWWANAQQDVIGYASYIYRQALKLGIAKECARKVLPEGLTETTLYMNGYFRSWIHYLAQRTDPSTQKEHRDVALAIEAALAERFPKIFGSQE